MVNKSITDKVLETSTSCDDFDKGIPMQKVLAKISESI
jgi:hypothetical protein